MSVKKKSSVVNCLGFLLVCVGRQGGVIHAFELPSHSKLPLASAGVISSKARTTTIVKYSVREEEPNGTLYDNFFYEPAPDINIAPAAPQEPAAIERMATPGGAPEATLPPPPEHPVHHKQAINIGPLLGYDKGYPWLTVLGPHYHFDTRENYVERNYPYTQGQALNVGPLLGLDKGYPWKDALARQPVAIRTQYQEVNPVAPSVQALNVGPLLGLDKGFRWKDALAKQPVALRTQSVESEPNKPHMALDIGPLLLLDKGVSWNLGPGAMERCRMETFVQ